MITGLSDHNMVLISRKLVGKRFTTYTEHFGVTKNKQEEFKAVMRDIKWSDLLSNNNLEIISQNLIGKLCSTINEFSVTVKHKNKKQTLPWVTEEVKNLMKERDRALKIATKSKLSHDRFKFTMLRNRVTNALRKATIMENT